MNSLSFEKTASILRFLIILLFFAFPMSVYAQSQEADQLIVIYKWRSPSVPPPFSWQYQITLTSNSEGVIEVTPGRSVANDKLPRWTSTLFPSKGQLEELKNAVHSYGLLGKHPWDLYPAKNSIALPPIPGSDHCEIVIKKIVSSSANEFLVPCDNDVLGESERKKKDSFVAMIKNSVPESEWSRFSKLRQEFISNVQLRQTYH